MMSDYDLIASFYDIEHADYSEDVELYRDFAVVCNGPVLELACGSGRLLLPLAEDGYEVTGVDTSATMLKLAQRRLEHAGVASHCTLVQQDMCSLQLERKFRLALIALGSFGHISTRKQQEQALAAVRAHLTPGGMFIVDIANADARYLENMSGQLLHQGTWQDKGVPHDTSGSYGESSIHRDATRDHQKPRMLTHLVSPTASTTRRLLELTHFYDYYRQGEAVERTIVRTWIYLFERSEMELLLEHAGFVIKDVYGDYELGPFERESPRMIFRAEAG